jgi:ribosomal protein S12 methylthiotransferase accessory factor
MMDIAITLAGGKKVDGKVGEFLIRTDQSVEEGGEASAPEPYTLFLASIGTCAGAYVVGFCEARKIPFDGIRLFQSHEFDPEKHRLRKVRIEIRVPPDFPEKYRKPLARVAGQCAVKRTLLDPPEFDLETTTEG